jgi:DNA-binding IscR family transcriptional regulator
VQAIDPIRRILTCPLGLKSHGTRLCAVHRRLDDAMEAAEKVFKSSTLADMLDDPSPSKPLCDSDEETLESDKRGRAVKLTVRKKSVT